MLSTRYAGVDSRSLHDHVSNGERDLRVGHRSRIEVITLIFVCVISVTRCVCIYEHTPAGRRARAVMPRRGTSRYSCTVRSTPSCTPPYGAASAGQAQSACLLHYLQSCILEASTRSCSAAHGARIVLERHQTPESFRALAQASAQPPSSKELAACCAPDCAGF